MNKIKVGINGMGRIGKNLCRVITQDLQDYFDIVAGNDIVAVEALARSFRRDSTHGRFPVEVNLLADNVMQLGPNRVKLFAEKDAANIPWGAWGVDIVFECTGFYLTREKASAHLQAGAKKVIISAPPKDKTPIFVVGVNDDRIAPGIDIISNASCTTNCLAPIVKALDDAFGVVSGLISTTHAVTMGQKVIDGIGSERNRATLNNIIPTSTGAARAIGKVLPHLEGLLNGTSLRVPVDDGSVVEAVMVIKGQHTVDQILAAMKEQAKQQNQRSVLNTVLYIGDDYEVSADAVGSSWSSMVLSNNAMVIPFDTYTLVKLTSFYDNEIGYSYRMADLAITFSQV
ncbi:MAG: type I glyceraldehyde-3-phosphate dehydrogenase [Anaerolineae bacterium]|nr:type I glyceraldehyde-3-phosphate dehydrogenase [Anaerolineae bacterium]